VRPGFITGAVKETLPATRVYGLDYSLRAIEYAARRFRNVEFVVADAYSSPFAPASFDVVICNNIWEHVDDPLAMLTSVRRILKSRGISSSRPQADTGWRTSCARSSENPAC
jgi:ubiquinone/menaquinone biosynthesis C-methylase UbiE